MKRLLFVLLIAVAAHAQRPIKFEDLAAMQRIGAPKVSPDGKWIAYDVSTIDLDANVRRSAIWLMPADGSAAARKLTDGTKQDEGPAWSPDGKTLAYVSNREGAAKQVYLLGIGSGKATKLTSLANGAAAVKWLPDGSGLVLTTEVYPECGVDPQCTEQKDTAADR